MFIGILYEHWVLNEHIRYFQLNIDIMNDYEIPDRMNIDVTLALPLIFFLNPQFIFT